MALVTTDSISEDMPLGVGRHGTDMDRSRPTFLGSVATTVSVFISVAARSKCIRPSLPLLSSTMLVAVVVVAGAGVDSPLHIRFY